MNKQTITARENFARADVFLSENLQGYTRSAVKKHFQNGFVTAKGKPHKPTSKKKNPRNTKNKPRLKKE